MTSVSSEITNMQNQTAYNNMLTGKDKTVKDNDSNMFLTLMLQQLQNQDPTQPTDNTEWLAQLAQYSSLEQMTQMNQGLTDCMSYLSAMYNDMSLNSEITQTLSLIGKEITLKDPEDPAGKKTITGKVSEASFEDGTGKVKVGDKYYSIGNIISVKEKDSVRWQVSESVDEMTDSKNVWKSLVSENLVHFSFPYEGGSSLNVCVRYMKKYGTNVILTISKGQLLSNEYNGTNYVTVRFDDDAPQKFYTTEPADGSSDCLFLTNARKFIKRAKTAKSIKIQVPVYQEGNPTFTFKVDVPLTWEY